MPTQRGFHETVLVGRRIVVMGGRGAEVVEALDLDSMQWTTLRPMPDARARFAAGAIGALVYVTGGEQSYGGPILRRRVVEYDPATDAWTAWK